MRRNRVAEPHGWVCVVAFSLVVAAGCDSADGGGQASPTTAPTTTGSIPVQAATGSAPSTLPTEVLTPLAATPLASPRPVLATDDRVHLAYELFVLNPTNSVMTIEKIETLDASAGDAGVGAETGEQIVSSLEGEDLDGATKLADPDAVKRTLQAQQFSRLFFDATFAKDAALPTVLTHRFTFSLTPASGAPTTNTVVSGRTTVTDQTAVVLGPPMRGPRWVTFGGCCFPASYHRTALLPINGQYFSPERFAIDFIQLDPENKMFSGPDDQISSYAFYGADLLAVADGTIFAVQDGEPDQTPARLDPTQDVSDLRKGLGNFVLIDIGNGRFAFYAHAVPGSVAVKAGDRVSRGQVIAELGNSGNTDAPHLHFAILDGPGPLGANSLPYVFDSFIVGGTVTTPAEQLQKTGEAAVVDPTPSGQRTNQMPLQNQLIEFPG